MGEEVTHGTSRTAPNPCDIKFCCVSLLACGALLWPPEPDQDQPEGSMIPQGEKLKAGAPRSPENGVDGRLARRHSAVSGRQESCGGGALGM